MQQLSQFAEVTTGVVWIHAAPAALCPHVEWALSRTLDARATLKWSEQEAVPGMQRAVVDWVGPVGSGARMANTLREWNSIRFEVTEDPSEGVDGERFCYAPGLGLWRGTMSASGDTLLGEAQLRSMMLEQGPEGMQTAMDSLLGTAWDDALEPFRMGGQGAEVTWLSQAVS